MLNQWLIQITLASVTVLGLCACTGLEPILIIPRHSTKAPANLTVNKSERIQVAIPSEANLGKRVDLQNEPMIPATLSRQITNDLWDRLPKHFTISIPTHTPQVQSQIRWFLRHQEFLNHTAKRAAPYMYSILERVQERNLPAELALLPIIESAYYPMASSSVGATGLWQLMPGTANKFGLKQDWWYDGRRDIFASTNAALDYFTYLQNYFDGNWLLAIAAYDSGEGTVQNAIQRNANQGKNTDFWSLPLPQETMLYVPRLLALAEIIRNRKTYPINLPPIDDQPYLGQVDVDSQIKLTDAARLAGLSLPEFKQLNPGYRHLDADPHGPYKITLPINKIALFRENMTNGAAIPEQALDSTDTDPKTGLAIAKVQQDATLIDSLPNKVSSILGEEPQAQTSATPTLAQEEDNDGENEGAINKSGNTAIAIEPGAAHPPIKAIKQTIYYRVKPGENLSTIAIHNKIKLADLHKWNPISTLSHLKPGTKLIIGYQSFSLQDKTIVDSVSQPTIKKYSQHKTTHPTKHINIHRMDHKKSSRTMHKRYKASTTKKLKPKKILKA